MLTTACASQFPLTGCVVKLAAQFVLSLNLAIGASVRRLQQKGFLDIRKTFGRLPDLCAAAAAQAQEVVALAEEKRSQFWKALGVMNQGSALALAGRGFGRD